MNILVIAVTLAFVLLLDLVMMLLLVLIRIDQINLFDSINKIYEKGFKDGTRNSNSKD